MYLETVDIISNKRRFTKTCGRDVTAAALELLRHPEAGLSFVHIAGTNGKGSTAAFMHSMLSQTMKNEKIGLFTSPHLLDFCERIKVGQDYIDQDSVDRIGTMLLNMDFGALEPTMFDYCLLMALIYFKEQGVKYAVIETGLGGAKDSTAAIGKPDVSVITSIGLEHTAILGDTVEKIAAEKAGIIKPGSKVFVGKLPKEALEVIENVCNQPDISTQCIVIDGPLDKSIDTGLFGKYQRYNGALALAATQEFLKINKIEYTKADLLSGLKEAKWPGRMEIVNTEPFVLLDGAHNPQGINALAEGLKDGFPGEKFLFLISILTDKDYKCMIKALAPLAQDFIVTKIDYERGLDLELLAAAVRENGFEPRTIDKVDSAFKEALKRAQDENIKLVISGSLYFIGAIKKILE